MRAASGIPKGQQDAMVDGMVQSLAAKLAANPKNVDGWIMLMRSHTTLGQTVKASAALKSATAANPGDTARLNAAARELGIAI
jgi:cytochrome c-type biogenesis protein CcmH